MTECDVKLLMVRFLPPQESAIPLVEENFASNKPHYTASLSAATLDWEQDLEKCEALQDIGAIDLIM